MSNDKNFSRRQLLQASAAMASVASLSPIELMMKVMMDGLLSKAHAQALGVPARNYVFIQLTGGPPRWTWCPFTPFDSDGDLAKHQKVATRYISSSQTEYKTTNIGGLNMPWMWQFDVPKAGGGNRPMSELMEDILFLRGVDCNNPAHNGANVLQFLPSGAKSSLTALSADVNPHPISHINMNTRQQVWKSSAEKTNVNLDLSGNLLRNLLDPFIGISSSSFKTNKNKIDQAIKKSMENFSSLAKSEHPDSGGIIASQSDALDLMRRGFNDIDSEYTRLSAKYKDIIDRAMSITNLNGFAGAESVRSKYSGGYYKYLEKYFAVTEYVLVNGFSSSISFGFLGLRKSNALVGSFDEHGYGPVTSLYFQTMVNRVLAACILELKDVLKTKGIWDDTLINLSGEFGRVPGYRSGTEHAPEASTISLISGALKGKQVIGNIKASKAHGEKAYNDGVGYLGLGHLANTISHILGTGPVFTATPSLVKEVNGTFESILPGGRLK